MRILSSLAAASALLIATAAPAVVPHRAPAARPAAHAVDWSKLSVATPEGGIRLGNPQAKVKLVEFFSFTCPHCAAFAGEAFGPLTDKYVKGGLVSVELRSALRDRLDFVAAQAARCGGPARAFGNAEAILATQTDWEQKAIAWDGDHRADFQVAGGPAAMKQLADAAGLTAIVAKRGVPQAAFARCFGDKAVTDTLQKTTEDAWNTRHIAGTPAFLINGAIQENVVTWGQLEPLIQAALKG
jgi:protein-disulfide isomerase